METGTVKFFDTKKGFGFIKRANGQSDVFVGAKSLTQWQTLEEGDKVEFEIEQGKKGPQAVDVVLV